MVAALTLLAALEHPAWSQGFGKMGSHFGRMGVNGKKPTVAVGPGCATSGLKFNVACNSQYATVIHF